MAGTSGKALFAKVVRWSGIPWAVRQLVARRRPSIVLYHDPAPEVLAAHVDYLTKRYRIVSLDALVTALVEGNLRGLPPKALAITFDDGWARNRELLPVMERLPAKPTLFVSTGIVGTHRHFWYTAHEEDFLRLLVLDNDERLAELETRSGFTPEREYERRQTLTNEELAEMAAVMDLQPHGRYHFPLATCSEDVARSEIESSRASLAERFGDEPRHFAYPHGVFGDREARLCREAGFRSARSTAFGWVQPTSDPYRLPVVGVTDDADLDWLVVQMSGVPHLTARWAKRVRKGSRRLLGRLRPGSGR